MCNFYRMAKSSAEVVKLFKAMIGSNSNAPAEICLGYSGLVEAAGGLRSMAWGFPLVLKGKSGQSLEPKPCNNTRADKLDSFMWRYSFGERRCLIPVTQFAEAEGEKGAKTRTWFSLPDQPVFAVAGIWCDTPEWGPAYAMVMTEACAHVAGLHDRMPVVLPRQDWSHSTIAPAAEARELCAPYPGEMIVRPNMETWARR
jgi:putative SOS response-associated peptidase YedK